MATVYEAVHRNQNRVAIKMIHEYINIDFRKRFLREGYVANTVGHPGAVIVFDDDVTEDGSQFLVMELLEGQDLDSLCTTQGGTLQLADVLNIADGLLDVLQAAHQKGIVHRDIKPQNLFLTRDGRLKVLDFGIARVREVSQVSTGSTTGSSFLGTPSFAAPEQARARWDQIDARTDLWAVGATLFTLLAGRRVHEAPSVSEQLALAVTTPAPSIAKFRPDLPPSVVELIDRALEYEREARWSDARGMRTALRDAMKECGVAPSLGDLAGRASQAEMVSVRAAGATADSEGPTLLATGHHRLDGKDQSSVGTFANGVSSAAEEQHRSAARRRLVMVLVAASVLVAAAITMYGVSKKTEDLQAAASPSATEPRVSGSALAGPGPSGTRETAVLSPPAVIQATDGGIPDATAPEAQIKAAPLRVAPSSTRARSKPAPRQAPAQRPAPSENEDVFDIRY
jgi:serine/threonine-protein kinase